jgi:hypothetical protein
MRTSTDEIEQRLIKAGAPAEFIERHARALEQWRRQHPPRKPKPKRVRLYDYDEEGDQ